MERLWGIDAEWEPDERRGETKTDLDLHTLTQHSADHKEALPTVILVHTLTVIYIQ